MIRSEFLVRNGSKKIGVVSFGPDDFQTCVVINAFLSPIKKEIHENPEGLKRITIETLSDPWDLKAKIHWQAVFYQIGQKIAQDGIRLPELSLIL